jgi:threonine dehydratase
MDSLPLLSVENIATAYDVIDPCFRDSPQFEADALNNRFDCQLVLKVETLNPIRSFKARGAQFFVSERKDDTPLVCATAGNFGQGMAYAARQRRIPLTVFVNTDASPIKVERMRAMGAQIRAVGTQSDEANAAAAQFAAETNAVLVVDGQEPAIAEGAGTIGLELLRYADELAAILVPLGDGALLAGIGCWVKAHSPSTRIVGVSPVGVPALRESVRQGHIVSAPSSTIADALAVQTPFPEAVARVRACTDQILEVEDQTLIDGMRLAYRELGLVLEPGGAAALAALLTHGANFRKQCVAAVLSGGNLTREQMQRWLERD